MKTLYILACCCFILAIVADVVGKQCHTRMLSRRARLTAQTVEAPIMQEQLPEVLFVERHSDISGLLAAGLGIATWIASARQGKRKGKRLTPAVPLVLLLAYLMLAFLVIV